MMYNYPFFSFPSFRNYNYYSTNCANHFSSVQPKADTNNSNFKSQHRQNMFSYMSKNILGQKSNNYLTFPKQTSTNKLLNNEYISKYKAKNKNLNCKTSQNNLTTNNILSNSKEEHDEIFKIFGIKLYFDDILLISLIFFLYSEGVKDDSLFISLILLLLT